jgi:hypothetical protein
MLVIFILRLYVHINYSFLTSLPLPYAQQKNLQDASLPDLEVCSPYNVVVTGSLDRLNPPGKWPISMSILYAHKLITVPHQVVQKILKLPQHLFVENTELHNTCTNGCLIRKILGISCGFGFRFSSADHNLTPRFQFILSRTLGEALSSRTMSLTDCILQCPDIE